MTAELRPSGSSAPAGSFVPAAAPSEPPGAATRDRLLDAAEQLFASDGVQATSLRRITRAAEANLAAVNYHFGSKSALAVEVFRRLVGPVNDERLRRLDSLESTAANGGQAAAPPAVEAVLEAFLAPALELRGSGSAANLRRLMVRVHSEGDAELTDLLFAEFDDVARRFSAALGRVCSHLGPADVLCRLRFTIGSLVFALVDPPHPLSPGGIRGSSPPDARATLSELVRFAAAGFLAPAGGKGDPGEAGP